jgi:hypothetical protein
MPIAPAIPLIIQGVGAIAGHYAGKKATANAMKRSPEEEKALQGGQQTGQESLDTAGGLMKQGRPMIDDAGSYYKTLLHGNRAAMGLATAAPRAAITDAYRGADRGLQQSGLRGAAKDVQSGEMQRQRAGQIAGLTTGVQPAAAEALGNLGTETTRTATPLYNTAGNVFTNLLGQGAGNREYARGEGTKAAEQVGNITRTAGDLAAGVFKPKFKVPQPTAGSPTSGGMYPGVPIYNPKF